MSIKPTEQRWHARLSHCNHKFFSQVLKTCNIPCNTQIQFCDACVVGKSHQLLYYIY